MLEEWKVVHDCPSYEISNLGRLRTIKTGVIKKPYLHKQGYLMYSLSEGGKPYAKTAHRMVGIAFIPNPENKPNVCHNDGNPLNCHITNLRWDDQRGNLFDTIEHGTAVRGERVKHARLTLEDVIFIKEAVAGGTYHGQVKDLADILGQPYGRVFDVVSGKTWMHVKI